MSLIIPILGKLENTANPVPISRCREVNPTDLMGVGELGGCGGAQSSNDLAIRGISNEMLGGSSGD
jgi:hypothetical protein